MTSQKHLGFVGAGFASAVLARELVENGPYRATILEKRGHLAGNCHTYRDSGSGILIHEYGPHIFHTSREDVWNYLNQFADFGDYINRVKAETARGFFSLPINLKTINQFFNKSMSPEEAETFLKTQGDSRIKEPQNFEEQALKMLGQELYENFFYGYTKKQWGVEPCELPASILKRLPVRFTEDDNYFNDRFQGIPVDGYTAIVEKLLDHPKIEVQLNRAFEPGVELNFDHLFFSGPLDSYFDFRLGRLRYRSLRFERFDQDEDFQGRAITNYCEEKVPYTRIAEHKFFAPWESHTKTVCFREYPQACGPKDTPYYPMRLAKDKKLLEDYVAEVQKSERLSFIGRLGTYRYLDMHQVIGESLDLAKQCLATPIEAWPKFSQAPL